MTTLPPPVVRFRELLTDQPPVTTAVIATKAWMRRPRLPRVPLEIRMVHRLGHEFAHDIRMGRGPLSFGFGLDAYVDGRGLMKVGPPVQHGPHFDQGALIALRAEALGFPSSWEGRQGVRWEPVDDGTARLRLPGRRGRSRSPSASIEPPLPGVLRGRPLQVGRAEGPLDGPDRRLATVRRRPGASALGGAVGGRAVPMARMVTTRIEVDAPVEEALARGRAVLARAGRERTPDAGHDVGTTGKEDHR